MKQPGSFLKGSGPDDTQRARTAPAAPGGKVDESRQAWVLFLSNKVVPIGRAKRKAAPTITQSEKAQ